MTWVAVGVGAGTAVGGAAGGKKASKGNKAANLQAEIANRLFTETDPLRMQLLGRSSSFLGAPTAATMPGASGIRTGSVLGVPIQVDANGQLVGMGANGGPMPGASPGVPAAGGFGDVRATPTFAAFKDAADRTFLRGKDNAISRLPAGGALTDALVGLEGDRASTLTQGAGSIYESELARAMTLATGQTGTAISGLGAAANAQALQSQAAAQQSAAKSGAMGTGLGAWMGNKQGTATAPSGTSSGKG